ncbi:hypothetical protein [Helicobacter sp. 23-1045]
MAICSWVCNSHGVAPIASSIDTQSLISSQRKPRRAKPYRNYFDCCNIRHCENLRTAESTIISSLRDFAIAESALLSVIARSRTLGDFVAIH